MRERPRILVIDDSQLTLELARDALQEEGYEVDVAADLTTFESHRSAHAPDLIVIDVQMPEALGDDLASMLRGAYGVGAPILLLSSLPEADLASRAMRADVWGYVSKHNGMEALIARVKEALGRPTLPVPTGNQEGV
jgi:DNA-binding response OmpR family regulator